MCRLCKELNGTQSLNERDYFPYGEIMGVGLRHCASEAWICGQPAGAVTAGVIVSGMRH
jgi:hypothetical protein